MKPSAVKQKRSSLVFKPLVSAAKKTSNQIKKTQPLSIDPLVSTPTPSWVQTETIKTVKKTSGPSAPKKTISKTPTHRSAKTLKHRHTDLPISSDVIRSSETLLHIGDAAKFLKVSIDTLRRWEKTGKISPTRTPGGTRLYSKEVLEQAKTPDFKSGNNKTSGVESLFSISEAAKKLGVSTKTLRRWDEAGKLIASRNKEGERVYKETEIEEFLGVSSQGDALAYAKASPYKAQGSDPEIITIATYELSQSLPQYIKRVSVFAAAALVITLLLTSSLVAGYFTKPQMMGRLFAAQGQVSGIKYQGPQTEKISKELASNQSAVDTIRAQQQILGESTSSSRNTYYSLLNTFLSPFNNLAQNIIEAVAPAKARDLGFYQQSTDTRFDLDERAIIEVDDKTIAQKEDFSQKLSETSSSLASDFRLLATNIGTTTTNLLRNSSFEKNASGQPDSWFYVNESASNNTIVNNASVRTGNHALLLEPKNGKENFGIYQPYFVTKFERPYTLSLYLDNQSAQTFTLKLGFWDKNNNRRIAAKDIEVASSPGWKRYSYTLDPPDEGVTGLDFYPMIEALGLSAKNVFIDDIQLEEGEAASTYEQENMTAGDGSIAIDANGNITPTTSRTGSLGTDSFRFGSLYLTKAHIDSDGNANFGGSLTVASSATIAADLTVNGDDIQSSSSTFRLFPENVLNLTIGGSATAIGIGSANGTTTINNNLSVTGTLSIASPLLLSDGTASAPGLAFTNDTNSGLYRLGADTIGLITGGSATSGITISSSGNVGIGTTSPLALTHIYQTGAADALRVDDAAGDSSYFVIDQYGNVGIGTTQTELQFNVMDSRTGDVAMAQFRNWDNTSGNRAFIRVRQLATAEGSTSAYFGQGQDQKLYIINNNLSSNATLMVMDNTGKIGLGTTSPASKLGVVGNTSIGSTYGTVAAPTDGMIVEGNVGIGTTSPLAALDVRSDTGLYLGAGSDLQITLSSDDIYFKQATQDKDVYFQVNDGGTNTNLMFLDGSLSRVGIGTTSPEELVHIASSTDADLHLSTASNVDDSFLRFIRSKGSLGARTIVTDGTSLGGFDTMGYDGASDLVGAYIRGDVDGTPGLGDMPGRLVFGTTLDGASGSTERMRITNTGNVGIGTTNPLYKLEVNGTTNIAGALSVTGNITPNADDTYDLGSNTARWQDIYLGPGSMHIGTSTSDEYVLSYNTTSNYLGFNVNGSGDPEIVMDTSGNLGIGTTDPQDALHVSGTGITQIRIKSTNASNVSSKFLLYNDIDALGQLSLIGSEASGANLALIPSSLNVGSTGTGGLLLLATSADAPIRFGTGSTALGNERMRITGAGNVGIGTTAPGYKFEISGSGADLFNLYRSTSNAYMRVTSAGGYGYFGTLSTGNLYLESMDNKDIEFWDDSANLMIIKDGGNVGIGTTAPSNLFSVGSTSQFQVNSSGYALLPDGAAATPSLSFTGDTNTGMYRLGDDILRLTTAGSATAGITINAAGNVGIGTTSPSVALSFGTQFESMAGTSNALRLYDDGEANTSISNNSYGFGVKDGNQISYTAGTGGAHRFYTANTERLVITSTGNVGIGTTSPGALLELNTTTAGTPVSVLKLKNSNAAYQAAGMEFLSSLGGSTGMQNVGRIYGIATAEDWATARVTIQVPNGGGTLTDALTVQNGEVGIGTTSPDTKLHVVGTNTGAGLVRINNSGGSAGDINGIDFYNAGNLQAYIRNEIADGYATKLYLGTAAGQNNATARVTIDSTGNVGIGTTAPSNLFSVGSTSQFQVNSSGYALLPDGAVGTPSLSFVSDPNSGLYSGGADILRFTTGGANRMTIDAGGNVGIGTTAPGTRLGVVDPSDSATVMQLTIGNRTNNNPKIGFIALTPGSTDSAPTAGIEWGTDGTVYGTYLGFHTREDNEGSPYHFERMRITKGGNVGIGTTAPGQKLDLLTGSSYGIGGTAVLSGTTLGSGVVTSSLTTVGALASGSIASGFGIISTGNTITTTGTMGTAATTTFTGAGATFSANVNANGGLDIDDAFVVADGGALTTSQASTFNGNLFFGTSTGILSSTGNVGIGTTTPSVGTRLSVMGGNVGIGTTAPGQLFEVRKDQNSISGMKLDNQQNGTSARSILYLDALNVEGYLQAVSSSFTEGNAFRADTISLDAASSASGGLLLGTLGNAPVIFYSGGDIGSDVSYERMRITGAGNVGIGTTAPLAKLDISGDTASLRFTETGTGARTWEVGSGVVSNGFLSFYDVSYPNESVLTLDTSRRIGVRDTAPNAVFEISGDGDVTNDLFMVSSSNTTNGDKFIVKNGGNVGIGTTSPLSLLQLRTATGSDPSFSLADADVAHSFTSLAQADMFYHLSPLSSTAGGAQLQSFSDGDASGFNLKVGIGTTNPTDSTPAIKLIGGKLSGTTLGDLGATETVFQVANNDDNPAITVLGSGYVGIGTTNPEKDFIVYGATAPIARILTPAGKNPILSIGQGAISGDADNNYADLTFDGASYGGTDDILFRSYYSAAYHTIWRTPTGTSNFTVPEGNVGIGTTTPGTNTRLSVMGGNVGIGTTQAGWALDVVGNANISTGSTYKIAGTDVLSGTTLGTGVLTSSLTTVGALASGSIASGFGTISTGNTITTTGTMGTAGTTTFTGAGATFSANVNANGGLDIDDAFVIADGGALTTSQAATFNGNLFFGTSTGILASGGNVGIGTTSPVAELEINKAKSGGSVDVRIRNSSNTAGSDARLILSTGGTSAGDSIVYFANDTNEWFMGLDNSDSAKFKIGTSTLGAGDRLTIQSDGNVGIGTTAPLAKFEVSSTSGTNTARFGGSQNPQINLMTNSSTATARNWGFGTNNNAFGDFNLFVSTDNTAIPFTSVLTALSSGYVGIGDASPLALFTVGDGDLFQVNSSGYALLPDGAAATPSLSFTGDTNTGMYRLGDDILRLTTAGSATAGITIDSTGNVGIGTTAPSGTLELAQGLTGASSGTNYILKLDPTLSGAVNTTAMTSLYGTYSVPAINLSGTSGTLTNWYGNYVGGSVGTGTTTTVTNWNGIYVASPTTSATGTITNKYALVTEASAGNVGIGTTTSTLSRLTIAGGSTTTGLAFLVQDSAYTNRFAIQGNGNVGIGTTSPTYKLDVLDLTTGGGSHDVLRVAQEGAAAAGNSANILFDASSTNNSYNAAQGRIRGIDAGDHGLDFAFDLHENTQSSNIYERMRITSYGNVGIGTTSPVSLLQLRTAASSDPSFSLADGDVAHGVTTIAPTDDFLRITPISSTVGGAYINGIADATGVALQLRGIQSSDPTDSTPAIFLVGAKASGTGVQDLGAAETVFQIANNDDAAALTILGNGNVGIGTTGPAVKLDFGTSVTNVQQIINIRTSGNTRSGIGMSPTDGAITLYSADNEGGIRFGVIAAADGTTWTQRMHMTQEGNLGIGIDLPLSKLGIEGNAAIGSAYSDISAPTNGLIVEGNVGIGTTAPLSMLQLRTAASSDPSFSLADADVAHSFTSLAQADMFYHLSPLSSTAGGAQLQAFSDGDASGFNLKVGIGTTNPTDSTPAIKLIGGKLSGTTLGDLAATETVFQVANNDDAPALTILGNGNIGIGTTSPADKLQVGSLSTSQTINTYLDIYGGLSSNTGLRIKRYDGNYGFTIEDINALNGLNFIRHNNDATGVSAMFISEGTGNVGIGTTNPGGKLEVASGNIFFGDTSNAQMTQGLTINQGANDDEILALKSSDVAHGVTTRTETDTFASISKLAANDGGLLIRAFADTGNTGLMLQGYAPTDSTDKTTAAFGYITLYGRKNSGTGETDPGTDANLLTIRGHDTARFIFDEEGELHLIPSSGSNTVISPSSTSSFMGGNVGIGTTAPVSLLQLRTAASSDPSFSLADGDVAHGVTTVAPTDDFLRITPISSTVGGAYINGLADATGVALQLRGIQSSDPTDSTPAIFLVGAKASGTGVQDLGAAETVFQVANNDDAAALSVMGNGRIGIGTTGPSSIVNISAAGAATVTLQNSANSISSKWQTTTTAVELTTEGAYPMIFYYSGADKIYMGSNIGLFGNQTFGTNAVGVLGIKNAGQRSETPVADVVQLWSYDYAAGDARLYLQSEAQTSDDAMILGNKALIGGQLASGNLTLESTSNATKGNIILSPTSGNVGIGTTSPGGTLELAQGLTGASSGTNYILKIDPTLSGAVNTTAMTSLYGNYSVPAINLSGTSGTLTNWYGNYVGGSVGTGTTTTVTNWNGIYVASPTTSATGTITNKYALVTEASAGNVGIGTTTSTLSRMTVAGGSATTGLAFLVQDSAYANRFAIQGNGNVGIGTTSPSYKLSISDGTDQIGIYPDGTDAQVKWTDGDLYLMSDEGASNADSIVFIRGKNNGVGRLYIEGPDDNGDRLSLVGENTYSEIQSLNNELRITTGANNADILLTPNGTGDVLVTAGNVGIGTTSPATKLEIVSTNNADIRLGEGGSLFTNIRWNIGSNQAEWDTDSYTYPIKLNGSNIVLQDASGGNVGIGTTAPLSKLEVNGAGAFGDGTVSLPGVTFSGDTNTGMYRVGADNLALAAAGVRAIDIKYDGGLSRSSIGINTAGASTGLLILGPGGRNGSWSTINATDTITISNTGGDAGAVEAARFTMKLDNSSGDTLTTASSIFAGIPTRSAGSATVTNTAALYVEGAGTFGTNNYAIYSGSGKNYFGGNVGIGTTGPGALLDVSGGSLSGWIPGPARIRGTGTETGLTLTNTGTSGRDYSIFSTGGASGGGAGNLIIADATAQAYRVTLDAGGNIGIGDTTPDYLLELYDATNTPTFGLSDDDIAHGVTTIANTDTFFHLSSISTTVGGAYINGIADATGVALQLRGIQSSDPTDSTPAIFLVGAKASGTGVQDLADAETIFQIANNDNTADLTILGNGFIGIGTVSPGAAPSTGQNANDPVNSALDINGSLVVSNTLDSELMTNGNNEAAAATFDNDSNSDASYAQSSEQAHAGTYSAKVTRTTAGTGSFRRYFVDNDLTKVSAGSLYKVSFWVYLPSGQTLDTLRIALGPTGAGDDSTHIREITTTNTWIQVVGYMAPTAGLYVDVPGLSGAQNDYFYIDDISIKKVIYGNVAAYTGKFGNGVLLGGPLLGYGTGTSFFSGNVGISTQAPLSKLGVLGNAAIGGTYGAVAAPANGMIIEGNVGIGTTSPSEVLHLGSGNIQINSAAGAGRSLQVSAGALGLKTIDGGNPIMFGIDNTTEMAFWGASTGLKIGTYTSEAAILAPNIADGATTVAYTFGTGNSLSTAGALHTKWSNSTTNLMVLNKGGNVGIGTTSPGGTLELAQGLTGASSGTNYILKIDPTLSGAVNTTAMTSLYGNYSVPAINLSGTSGTLTNWYGNYVGGSVGTGTTTTVTNWNGIYVASPTTSATGTITNKYALVTEASAGNVGIGTTTSTLSRMTVAGGSATTGLAFLVQDSAYANRFAIQGDGNVGIGTTGPSQKLDVNGNILVEGTNRIYLNDAGGENIYGDGSSLYIAAGSSVEFSSMLDLNNNSLDKVSSIRGYTNLDLYAGGGASDQVVRISTRNADNSADLARITVHGYAAVADVDIDNANLDVDNGGLYYQKSSGNVGIGTTAPGSPLDIKNNQNANTFLRVFNDTSAGAATAGIQLTSNTDAAMALYSISPGFSTNGAFIADSGIVQADSGLSGGLSIISDNTTSGMIRFYTDGSADANERMRIANNGNIGIGTTAPMAYLQIGTNTVTKDGIIGLRVEPTLPGGSAKYDAGVVIHPSQTGDTGTGLSIGLDVTPGYEVTTTKAYGTRIGPYANGNITNWTGLYISGKISGAGTITNNYALVTEAAAGNVGIGTTAPGQKLEVAGTILSKWASDGANSILFESQDSSGTVLASLRRSDGAGGTGNDVVIRSYEDIHLAPNNSDTALFTLKASGNVGIGTTAPVQKLEVNGASQFDGNVILSGDATRITKTYSAATTAQPAILIAQYNAGGAIGYGNALVRVDNRSSNDFLSFDNNGTSILNVIANGNIGVGDADPEARLDIDDTSNTAASFGLINNTATTIGNGANTLGVIDLASTSLTTGNFLNIELNALSSGKGINLTSTSTALSTGSLMALDWSPGSSTTGTGDLFSINMGANALGSSFLNLKDNGTSVFSVSQTAVTTSLPTSFTSAGDVGIAYDINMTNPTSSFIKSQSPMTIQAGESFGSSDLTLKTYNAGSTVITQDNNPTAAGTSYALQILPTLTSSTNSMTYTAQYGLYNVADVNLSGDAATDLTTLYSNYTGLTATAGTIGTWYGNYIAAPTGSGTVSTKYALVTEGSAGNVGIGTTSPGDLIHVRNGSGVANLRLEGNSGNPGLMFYVGSTLKAQIYEESGDDTLRLGTGTGAQSDLVIASNGNIGIGITSPLYSLDVSKSVAGGPVIAAIRNTDNTADSNSRLVIQSGGSSAGDAYVHLAVAGTSTEWAFGIDNSDSDKFKLATNGDLNVANVLTADLGGNIGINTTTPGNRFTVNGNVGIGTTATVNAGLSVMTGNVGIGTTGPTGKLHVVQGSNAVGILIDSEATNADALATTGKYAANFLQDLSGGYGLYVSRNLNEAGSNALVSFIDDHTANTQTTLKIQQDGTGDILNLFDGATEVFTVLDGGNVGIGTTSPATKVQIVGSSADPYGTVLSVNGSASTGAFIQVSDNTNWNWAMGGRAGATGDLSFFANRGPTAAGTEVVTIQRSNGNVGIGTTAPTAQLELSTGVAIKSSGTAWDNPSDIRLKNIERNYGYGLDEIMQINPIVFTFKEDNALGIVDPGEHIGIIAQEVQTVIPEAVSTGAQGYLKFNIDPILWASVNAIKELSTEQQELNTQIAAMRDSLQIEADGTINVSAIKAEKLLISTQISNLSLQTNGSSIVTVDPEGYSQPVSQTQYVALESRVETQESRVESLEDRIKALEEKLAQQATASAEIAGVTIEASTSAIATVEQPTPTPVLVLETSEATSSATASAEIASPSATIPYTLYPEPSELDLTAPEILLATTSAQLVDLSVTSEATFSGKLQAYEATISDTFKSFGQTFLGNTTVAGDFSVDGTMSVTGNSINSIGASPDGGPQGLLGGGTLYIQNSPLATAIDFFNGQVTIDKTGKLTAQEIVTNVVTAGQVNIIEQGSSSTIGTSTLTANQTRVAVFTDKVTQGSKIFITPRASTAGQALFVEAMEAGVGFVVSIDQALTHDLDFDWWIIEVK